MTLSTQLDIIKENQKTIDELLDSSTLFIEKQTEKWYVEAVYNDEICNIMFGVFPGDPAKGENMGSIPHYHESNKEYLICIQGSVLLNIEGGFVRKLKIGDCALINPGETHYSKPLEKDTKVLAICVPADKGYLEAFNQLKDKNG